LLLRVAILVALVAALPGLWLAVQTSAATRRRRAARHGDPELSQGIPTVLFFTGEHCTVCHYRQRPALDWLKSERNGTLRVVELDAASEPSLTRRFGVLSLPTTVVLAADGRVGAVNYGFASRAQLDAQLKSLTA
jgi:thioredoxin-like negative regulator of GroEL